MDLEVQINAPADRVWKHLADLESHSEWMSDAQAIVFETDQQTGIGTRMRVPTRVGPLHTTDIMTVIGWEDGRIIEVRHEGAVEGTGTFEIIPRGSGSFLLWGEQLHFPWWLGGRLGHKIAQPILRRIWSKNLSRFKDRVETATGP